MYLNASTDSIEIILGGTVTANQLQWNVSFQDITSSGMTLPQSAGAGLTNNATLVTMVAAPAALTTRQVTQINVYNADTATATVTIRKDVSGTKYVLIRYALTTLDTLMWSREDGWRVMSGGGSSSAITALTGDVTATGPGSAAATIANDAVTYAKMQNVSAASRLLGRGSAGGAGDVQEITLGSGLSMTGTSLSATGASYTFSTGLTEAAGTVTANLSTGVAGGQSVIGGTAASNNLTLSSTSNATKGKILFGTSAYDEVNNRLGIGTSSPDYFLTISHIGSNFSTRWQNTATAGRAGVFIQNNSTAYSGFGTYGTAFGAGFNNNTTFFSSHQLLIGSNDLGGTSGGILFTTGAGLTDERMRIFSAGNVAINTTTDAGFRLDVNGTARFQGRVTVNQDTTVATQTVSVIAAGTTNSGLVLQPNGTGAIMASAPDGTATGGNARGTNAVDLQTVRALNTYVASGARSFIGGGQSNLASGIDSFVGGGQTNEASGARSVVVGGGGNGTQNLASGIISTVCGGASNIASATSSSISGGYGAIAYLYGQRANASTEFVSKSDSQTSSITLRRSITGTAQAELFLDGSSARAILNISSPGPTNARAWRAQVDVVAIVATAGTGTLLLNECFMGSYHVGIKRVGTTTSLVGAVSVTNEVSDTNMATSVVTIDADDTNEALRIQFTPPTGGTSSATSVIRVVATAYITEVGR